MDRAAMRQINSYATTILPSCVALILPFAGSISPRPQESCDTGMSGPE